LIYFDPSTLKLNGYISFFSIKLNFVYVSIFDILTKFNLIELKILYLLFLKFRNLNILKIQTKINFNFALKFKD